MRHTMPWQMKFPNITYPHTSFNAELQFIGQWPHFCRYSQGPSSFSHAWSAPKATTYVHVRQACRLEVAL